MKRIKIIITIALAALIALAGGDAFARSLAELREERRLNQGRLEDQRAALAQAQEERDTVVAELILLDIELAEVTDAYLETLAELQAVEHYLEETEARLAAAEELRAVQFEQFRSQIRFLHENNNLSYIELLFSGGGIADFLNNIEHFGRIIEHGNNLLNSLIETEYQIALYRDQVDEKRLEVSGWVQELAHRRSTLEAAVYLKDQRLAEMMDDEDSHQALIDRMEAEDRAIAQLIRDTEAEIERQRRASQAAASRAQANVALDPNAAMLWPVQGSRRVTSGFGNRRHPISGRQEFHTGIDIGAPRGNHIFAALDGVVTFSGWRSGFGNTIIINHGSGVTTLYAHNTTNFVRAGDSVARGQVIGTIGSTGIATGPHLHFEVRHNGVAVNPGPYLGIR